MGPKIKRVIAIAVVSLVVLGVPTYFVAAHAVTSYRLAHSKLTARLCPIHHGLLRRTWVPVEYGDIAGWNEYSDARDHSFPYAHSAA